MCDYQNKFLSLKSALISIPVYVLMFCICYVAKTNAQNIYDTKNLRCSKYYCTTSDGTPITGLVKVYYRSGALRGEANFKNGKKEGPLKEYYESGALKVEVNWKNGKQDGLRKKYYESGALESESNWKNGKQDGLRKEYYESGALYVEENWKDDKADGIIKEYYESGALKSESNWKDDKQNGLRKEYYESGALKSEANWKNGKKEGLGKEYYESGALKVEANFKNGKHDGLVKLYYESGALEEESNWKDARKGGVTKKYDKNGILISEIKFDANEFKAPAVCIGAALQTLVCASNNVSSIQISKEMTNKLVDCFNSEYPGVSEDDFLEYYDEGKDMVLNATNYCNYISPAVGVVSNYCRNMYKLDRCLSQSYIGNFTGADTVSGAVYTLISRRR